MLLQLEAHGDPSGYEELSWNRRPLYGTSGVGLLYHVLKSSRAPAAAPPPAVPTPPATVLFSNRLRPENRLLKLARHGLGLFPGCLKGERPGPVAVLAKLARLEVDPVHVVGARPQHCGEQRFELREVSNRDDQSSANEVPDAFGIGPIARLDFEVLRLEVLGSMPCLFAAARMACIRRSLSSLAAARSASTVSTPSVRRTSSGVTRITPENVSAGRIAERRSLRVKPALFVCEKSVKRTRTQSIPNAMNEHGVTRRRDRPSRLFRAIPMAY